LLLVNLLALVGGLLALRWVLLALESVLVALIIHLLALIIHLLASRDLVPVNTALQNQRSIRQAEQQRVQENKKSMKG
jgi:Na+(H+)/acetate symporter ActP